MTTDAPAGGAAPPEAVRRLDGPAATRLAGLAAVFEDLQYALRCCEHLVGALDRPGDPDRALVEALWTGALVAYVRCFSPRGAVLTEADLAELQLDGDVGQAHAVLKKLRDHLASRHVNPREGFTVGVVEGPDGAPAGVAVVSGPLPPVDADAVRTLGRLAYALAALVDARMQEQQRAVRDEAAALSAAALSRLPLVRLDG
jgi:hypothetical protein